MTKTKSFTEALKRWENLAENSEEKLHYLAIYDGDREKAKWAFLRDKTEQKIAQSRSSEEPASIGSKPDVTKGFVKRFELQLNKLFNGLPIPIKNLMDGNCRFWVLWFGLVFFPNIAFKVITLAPQFDQDPSFARMTINTFCVFSILAFFILIKSFLKMTSRGERFRQVAAIILLITLVNFLISFPSIVNINSKDPSANSNTQIHYNSAKHTDAGIILVSKEEETCKKSVTNHLKNYFGFPKFGDYSWQPTHPLDRMTNRRKPSLPSHQSYGGFEWKIEQVKTIDGTEWQKGAHGEFVMLDVRLEGILSANPNPDRKYAYEEATNELVRNGFNTNTRNLKRLRYFCNSFGPIGFNTGLNAYFRIEPLTDKKRLLRFFRSLVSF